MDSYGDLILGFGGAVVGGLAVVLSVFLSKKLDRKSAARSANMALVKLLSEWLRPRYIHKDGRPTDRDLWRIQVAFWECLPWLDDELVLKVVETMANRPGASTPSDLVAELRRILLGRRRTRLSGRDLNVWPPERMRRSPRVPSRTPDVP